MTHHWCLTCSHVAICHACKGLLDLANGPNQPTATIIGEYSASYHDGALISTWFRVRISQDVWPKSGLTFLAWHIIDVWHVHTWPYAMLVKACQTLLMDPTSVLQQSLVNTVPHIMMVHWYLLGSGWEFQDLTKIWPNIFSMTHHWCLTCSHVAICHACKGLSDLANGLNQPTTTIIGEYSASYHDGALISTWFRVTRNFRMMTQKIWPNIFRWHIIDVWHVHYVGGCTCKGLSDLANGLNQPTTTIIGEYSASYHDGALISTWFRVRISGCLTKIWPNIFRWHIIDVWHVHTLADALVNGLLDLANGLNQPTATIIGEYSASYHDGALISTWFRVRISQDVWPKSGLTFLDDTSLMSDMFTRWRMHL